MLILPITITEIKHLMKYLPLRQSKVFGIFSINIKVSKFLCHKTAKEFEILLLKLFRRLDIFSKYRMKLKRLL
jgi:hypothetical protein